MNIINRIKEAQTGSLKGAITNLTMLNKELGGIYPGMYAVIASEEKVGKSTFVYEYFVASLVELNPDIDMEFNIISTEMPLEAFAAKLISRYIFTEHKQLISTRKLLGRELNENNERVFLTKDEMYVVEKVYNEKVKPIIGEYNDEGTLIHKGKVNWIPPLPPSELFSRFRDRAIANGELKEKPIYSENLTIIGHETASYKPHNPNKLIINIVDHIRQLPRPNNVVMKDNIDTMSKHLVKTMNDYKQVSIAVVHLNRWASDPQKLRHFGDRLIPTSDSTKDSGNLGEDFNTKFIASFIVIYYILK